MNTISFAAFCLSSQLALSVPRAEAAGDPSMVLKSMRARIAMDIGAARYDSLETWRDSARSAERALRINGFTPLEEYAIHLLSGKYARLLEPDSLRQLDSPEYEAKTAVERDPLSVNIAEDYVGKLSAIRAGIQSDSGLTEEERGFLSLLAVQMRYRVRAQEDTTQAIADSQLAEVNRLADAFLAAYPYTRRADFVRNAIRPEWRPSEWGIALGAGFGMAWFAGELGRTQRNSSVQVGLAAALTWRRIYGEFDVESIVSGKRRDLTIDDEVWPKKLDSDISRFVIGGGPILLDGSAFRLIALAQVGVTLFDVSENDKDRNGFESDPVFGPSFGLSGILDWKIVKGGSAGEMGDWGLRFRSAWIRPGLGNVVPELEGSYTNFALEVYMRVRNKVKVD